MLIQVLLNQIFTDVSLTISKLVLCGKWSSRNKAEPFSESPVLKALINSLFNKMHAVRLCKSISALNLWILCKLATEFSDFFA